MVETAPEKTNKEPKIFLIIYPLKICLPLKSFSGKTLFVDTSVHRPMASLLQAKSKFSLPGVFLSTGLQELTGII